MPRVLKRLVANVDEFPRQVERAIAECKTFPSIARVQVAVGPRTMEAMRDGTLNPPDLGSDQLRIDHELKFGDVVIEEAP